MLSVRLFSEASLASRDWYFFCKSLVDSLSRQIGAKCHILVMLAVDIKTTAGLIEMSVKYLIQKIPDCFIGIQNTR